MVKDGGCGSVTCVCGAKFNWATMIIYKFRAVTANSVIASTNKSSPPIRPGGLPPLRHISCPSIYFKTTIRKLIDEENIYTMDFVEYISQSCLVAGGVPSIPTFNFRFAKAERYIQLSFHKLVTAGIKKIGIDNVETTLRGIGWTIIPPQCSSTMLLVTPDILPRILDARPSVMWTTRHTWKIVIFLVAPVTDDLRVVSKMTDWSGGARIGAATFQFYIVRPASAYQSSSV